MILIRADANEKIGLGHVMRCLSIAHAFKDYGETVKFICSDESAEGIISKHGFERVYLVTDYSDMESELEELIPITDEASVILIDSYYVTAKYFDQLREHIRIAYIDDLNKQCWNVDWLINYNVFASVFDYSGYESKDTKMLLNPEYAPLRKEFSVISPHTISDKVSDILISAGGSDPLGVSEMIIKSICPAMPDIRFHFVVGALNPRITELKKLAHGNVFLHINETNMSSLMKKCDIAISSSGTTLYELCAMGIPTVAFSVADNQIPAAEQFDKLGIMFNAGDIRFNTDFIHVLEHKTRRLVIDKNLRSRLSIKMQELVDGSGSERIARQLLDSDPEG